jgi:hypothetical protein
MAGNIYTNAHSNLTVFPCAIGATYSNYHCCCLRCVPCACAVTCSGPTSVTASGVASSLYKCSIAVSAAAPLRPGTPWAYELQVNAVADGNWSTLVQVFASPDNNLQDNTRQCYAIIRTGTA